MPKPNKNETRQEYISRFMSSKDMIEKYPDKKQRYAVALSEWRSFHKKKETNVYLKFLKVKEDGERKVYTFIGANTLPDRVNGVNYNGERYDGEILSRNVLETFADKINNTAKMGDSAGTSYRTISLFHDRVKEGNPSLEEAGYVIPGSARVEPIPESPGNYQLLVDVEVNDYYIPNTYDDYTPEKIKYKIDKGVLGLSIEYNNQPDMEKIVEVEGKRYNYVFDSDQFGGFGFARANLIGNPYAVRVKESSLHYVKKMERFNSMEDKTKQELNAKIKEMESKIKEHESLIKSAKDLGVDSKVKELTEKLAEMEQKLKETKLKVNEDAQKFKEAFELALGNLKIKDVPKINDKKKVNAKIKEAYSFISENNFQKFRNESINNLSLSADKFKEQFRENKGFSFEENTTLKVKCSGKGFIVVPTQKTKDVLDSSDMAESTYYQTNAMFSDRFVLDITETFLMNDNLLKVLNKEQHLGGNDFYQWRLWTEFDSVSGDNTAAVNPNNTSVTKSFDNFEKMQTRICEYRVGVEVTDFTQYHSVAAIGDLMSIEINRKSEWVVNSMAADLFKGKTDATSGWNGFIGLIGYADSSTYGTLFGKTRSVTNRLLDSTLANTFSSTSEAISVSLVRKSIYKVCAHSSNLSDLVVVMHPNQYRRLLDTQDTNVRYPQVINAPAPGSFGFKTPQVPYIDNTPIILDWYCESSANAQDMYAVVDLSKNKGLNLVVSKPLELVGLAKIGLTNSAAVRFYGTSVYKSPRNVFVHTSLTST